jgi:hypothetical protein
MVMVFMVLGERRRRWHKERGEGDAGEREERVREALRLFFLDRNDYIAPLLIVLGILVS